MLCAYFNIKRKGKAKFQKSKKKLQTQPAVIFFPLSVM